MSKPAPTQVEVPVSDIDLIVSKANEAGDIIYFNPIFVKLSGYEKDELQDQPHSILRHPDMPKMIFKYFWDRLKAREEVYAFVKNLTKNGDHYWVYAFVRPALNPDGTVRNYVSTRKSMNPDAKAVIEPLYAKLLEAEASGGLEASEKALSEFLESEGHTIATFNDLMKKLQGDAE